MGAEAIPKRLRELIVTSYQAGGKTYGDVAKQFAVGTATVNRLLRLVRKGQSLTPGPHRGGAPRKIDDTWLEAHAKAHPDARLSDRVDAWEAHSGRRVTIPTMWHAMRRIGFTHKKRHPKRRSETGRMWSKNGVPS